MNQQRTFLVTLLAAAIGICFLMILPYMGYLLTGIILGFILKPVNDRINSITSYSSIVTVFLTIIVALLPLMILLGVVADDASQIVNSVENRDISLGQVEQQISPLTGEEFSLEERIKSSIQTIGSTVLSSTSQIASLASGVAIGLSILLFTQYYALKQGSEIVEWSKQLDVLPDSMQSEIYHKTAVTTRNVIKGHVITAMVSGIVAGIGLFLVGISNIAFWTFMMMIFGLIPLIGTALIWIPAAIYLLINGQLYSGLFLLAYGIVAVGSVDNFLRPFLIDEEADLHPMFIILGVIGGIGFFGPIGIFVGPVMFGIAKSLLKVYIDNYDQM